MTSRPHRQGHAPDCDWPDDHMGACPDRQPINCWCGGDVRSDEDGMWCLEDINHDPQPAPNDPEPGR